MGACGPHRTGREGPVFQFEPARDDAMTARAALL